MPNNSLKLHHEVFFCDQFVYHKQAVAAKTNGFSLYKKNSYTFLRSILIILENKIKCIKTNYFF